MTDRQHRMRQGIASLASSDITEAQKTIDALHSEIEDLKAQALGKEISDVPDVELSSKDVARVYTALKTQRVADLHAAYNKGYFDGYSEYTRFVIAKALVQLASDSKMEPAALWTTLVNKAGRM